MPVYVSEISLGYGVSLVRGLTIPLLQVSGGASQEKLKKFGGQSPLGRPGQPAELASIYVQLADNSGSYATGQVYSSSGGNGLP